MEFAEFRDVVDALCGSVDTDVTRLKEKGGNTTKLRWTMEREVFAQVVSYRGTELSANGQT